MGIFRRREADGWSSEAPGASGAGVGAGAARCTFCGAGLPPADGLRLDVRRPATELGSDAGGAAGGVAADAPVTLAFCSERHVARWFDGDAPQGGGPAPSSGPLTWADRLTVAAFALGVALFVGLTLVGLWTVGDWLF